MLKLVASLSSNDRSRGGLWAGLAALIAMSMTAVHLVQIYGIFLPSGLFKTLHLGFAIVIVSLTIIETKETKRLTVALAFLAAGLGIAATIYIFGAYDALVSVRAIFANRWDVAFAVALLISALYAAWWTWGWMIPALAILALLYGAFGYLFSGELLFHGGISLHRLMAYSSIPFFQGLLGGLTELSARTIFVFLFFGAVLQATGGIDFIVEMARRAGGRSRAGPAQVAVISSGAMGMISGSTVANVASTGAVTIPLMKRFGFKPEFAGAVEAAASMGGQLTPPVMGLAAFLIVGLTGIPYAEVMLAAIVPAIVYYAYLLLAVHLRAAKVGIDARTAPAAALLGPMTDRSGLGLAFGYVHLLAGIALLIYLLVVPLPPGTAALYAALFILLCDIVKHLGARSGSVGNRLKSAGLMVLRAFEGAGRAGAQIAVVLAVIGILVEILTITGFAQKLSAMMLALSDGSTLTLSIIVALSCIVFGLGLPTPAAYLLVALFGAPALVESGVPILVAHLFVFYFANVSAITPPVAVAALVAANIAKASFIKTAITSVRLGLPAYFLPFLFIAHPELVGIGGGWTEQIVFATVALGGIMAINMVIEGFAFGRIGWWQRVTLVLAAAALLFPGMWSSAIGGALFAAAFLPNILQQLARSGAAQVGRADE